MIEQPLAHDEIIDHAIAGQLRHRSVSMSASAPLTKPRRLLARTLAESSYQAGRVGDSPRPKRVHDVGQKAASRSGAAGM